MNEQDRKKQELLEELARRFRHSAHSLRDVARRIKDAADLHHATMNRIDRAGQRLRDCVESQNGPMPFTYLEYIEFSNADEFEKFKDAAVITEEEIEAVDWDELSHQLLNA